MEKAVAYGIVFALVLGLATLWDQNCCEDRARKMGLQYDFGLSTGCMVHRNNEWIPIEAIRQVD